MPYVFDPVAPVAVPVSGSSSLFPVHRVYCVGRNYADHAKEVGHDVDAEPPLFFCKPAAAVLPVREGTVGVFPYPRQTEWVDYELELVVALGGEGRNVDVASAGELIFGYAAGFDMTRRDWHRRMMEGGKPWDISKGFTAAAPIGPIRPIDETGFIKAAHLWLDLNGERKQDSDVANMIWDVPTIISQLSRFFDLSAGDLIYTGTPKGVCPVVRGDLLHGGIAGLGELSIKVA